MQLHIRQAERADFASSELLTRDAFWDVYKPGADEHFVLHNLRKSESYIPDLDLVVMEGQTLIGHIICTRAFVIDPAGNKHSVLCAGPFSVRPQQQKQGVGISLMKTCIDKAHTLGHPGIILYGNPDYYHRFGYKNAAEFGIQTRDGANFEPFMALELDDHSLEEIHGRFFEDKAFFPDVEEFETYDTQFPPREKHVTPTQLHL